MLVIKVIEPAQTIWASTIVFVPEKNGILKICIDYCKLNTVTTRNSYHIPRMDECIDSLGDEKKCFTLDAGSGYWQVEVRKRDHEKTEFTSHPGVYQLKRILSDFQNCPAMFHRVIDLILSAGRWTHTLVYLNDIVISSRTTKEHIKRTRNVLLLLRDAVVILQFKKCAFFKITSDYLGHIIRPGRHAVANHVAEASLKTQDTNQGSCIRSFPGLCNLSEDFSRILRELRHLYYDILRKHKQKTWECLEKTSFMLLII